MAFPTTGVLDDFNRANEGPPPSASWTSAGPAHNFTSGSSTLLVSGNALDDNGGFVGGCWGTDFGPDCEVFYTFSTLPANSSHHWTYARLLNFNTAADGYAVLFVRDDANPGFDVLLFRLDDQIQTQLGANITDSSGAAAVGDKIGLECVGSDISCYRYRASWALVATRSDATYNSAGKIGTRIANANTVLDDFGGGTVASGPAPSAPDLFVSRSNFVLA